VWLQFIFFTSLGIWDGRRAKEPVAFLVKLSVHVAPIRAEDPVTHRFCSRSIAVNPDMRTPPAYQIQWIEV
jgi:hypothetical protein